MSSYLNLAAQTHRRRWRHLCGLKAPLTHHTLAYVTEHLNVADRRHVLASVAKTLKANKALEGCKLNGLLFLSLDANEHFHSRHRCCPDCCQRHVEVTDAQGHKQRVIEYYHRYVVAQINGPKLNVVLDLEPIRPGEGEGAAALRLLGRIRRVYGARFVDAVTVDAWYAKGPFLRRVERLGWAWVVVLKREDMDVFGEAHRLSQDHPPGRAFADPERPRTVQWWEVKELDFSPQYGRKVRVVRPQEQWGRRIRHEPQTRRWVWASSAELDGDDARLIYRAGHRRWGIENKAFNELAQAYHLEHCYHHEPVSMLAQRLILMLGFVLFSAFVELHSKLVWLEKMTAKTLAQELNLALEADLPWEQWFACG